MDILEMKSKLLDAMDSIDKNKLSLMELKMYAEILKTVSEIQVKSYMEMMADVMGSTRVPYQPPAVIGDLKGDA